MTKDTYVKELIDQDITRLEKEIEKLTQVLEHTEKEMGWRKGKLYSLYSGKEKLEAYLYD